MGLSAAKMLSSKGANVIIVARNKQRLETAYEEVAAAAKNPKTQRFFTIAQDVTTAAANEQLMATAIQWNNGEPPDIIWANAGSSTPSLFLDASADTLRAQMDVNYFSAAYLAQASLRAWLACPKPQSPPKPDGKKPTQKEKRRHFIMTSSTAAFVPVAGYAPYSPAKAALRSLHDQLSSEMNYYNGAFSKQTDPSPQMKIHTVFPGTILSPGLEQENKSKHQVTKILEDGEPEQTADQAAEAAIKELEKGRSLVTTQGWWGELMKACAWQGSVRDQPILNTLFSWVVSLVWLFVGWDMERKVWKLGEKEGVPVHNGLQTQAGTKDK